MWQEVGARTDSKVQLYSNVGSNAVQRSEPLSEYSRLCALLVPLCMPRAVEEVFFGPAQVSLATAPQVRSLLCMQPVRLGAGSRCGMLPALLLLYVQKMWAGFGSERVSLVPGCAGRELIMLVVRRLG